MSDVGVHDRWWVWRNEALQHAGPVPSAQEQQFIQDRPLPIGLPLSDPHKTTRIGGYG